MKNHALLRIKKSTLIWIQGLMMIGLIIILFIGLLFMYQEYSTIELTSVTPDIYWAVPSEDIEPLGIGGDLKTI